jgi:hypothetical protein
MMNLTMITCKVFGHIQYAQRGLVTRICFPLMALLINNLDFFFISND